MYRKPIILLVITLVATLAAWPQSPGDVWPRAFPITDYQVPLNDSLLVVQIQLPDGLTIREKQAGVLTGTYRTSAADTGQLGAGRCYLIKPPYHYFALRITPGSRAPRAGDLLYTLMDSTPIHFGLIPRLSAHFILLQSVYEQPCYDRFQVFTDWTARKESDVLDSLVSDIRFTGTYFLQEEPASDRRIEKGRYAGQQVYTLMKNAGREQVTDFLRYILARPRLYAGREWKIAEIFATWLFEGAPVVQAAGVKG